MIKNLLARINHIDLKDGSKLIIPVYGEVYGQGRSQSTLEVLYKKHKDKPIVFSLVPQDKYQKANNWPEEPFLNVLKEGKFKVSREDWIGYIHPFDPVFNDKTHDDRKIYTERIIQLGKKIPLTIRGKIIKEDDGYSVLLFASHKDIDEQLEKFS